MSELTKEQEEIINYPHDLLVLAGPGTGKTFTLLKKIKNLIEKGNSPDKIMLLTFSIKVCQELRDKLNSLRLKDVKVDTFHGLAYDLYREYYQKDPPLITEEDVKIILKKLSLDKKALKSTLFKREYYAYLERNSLLDFDFLLLKVSQLKFKNFSGYFIFIDEFQDLSLEILNFLNLFKLSTLYLFGDPNQSIYGFRGVNLEKIKTFLNGFRPQLKVLTLTQSFRCPKELLEAASAFKCSPWEIPPFHSSFRGGTLQGFLFHTYKEEKNFLAKLLRNLMGGLNLEESHQKAISPSDIFLLSRLKKVFEPLKEFLQKEGIPVAVPEEEAEKTKKEFQSIAEKVKHYKIPFEKIEEYLPPYPKNLLRNWYELFNRDQDKLSSFLQNLSSQDLVIPSLEGVNFLTIHSSKGLEAKIVVLYGAEEDLIPLRIFDEVDMEEEKRLLYVAITRSQRDFYFFANKERKVFNFSLSKGISSWLKDFPIRYFIPTPPKPKQKGLF